VIFKDLSDVYRFRVYKIMGQPASVVTFSGDFEAEVFTGQMPFLLPNPQRERAEGKNLTTH